ncbi:hypothetical protein BJX66DRAFT_297753, partial [Aspergillus keveii]
MFLSHSFSPVKMHFTPLLVFTIFTNTLPLSLAMPARLVLKEKDPFPEDADCIRRCFHERPHCAVGFEPKKGGDYWACCWKKEEVAGIEESGLQPILEVELELDLVDLL